jgi:uncharacterized membrane protein YvbJ
MPARFFFFIFGTEVKRNSGRCPQCGRLFAFVRCPQCGYRAEEEKFAQGCPVCGYCTNEKNKTVPKAKKPSLIKSGKLPLWVYIVAFLGLALVALVLLLIIK